MDKIGVKELLNTGVRRAQAAWDAVERGESAMGSPDIDAVLDRFTQVGVTALEHDLEWLWGEVADALLSVYRLGIPKDPAGWPDGPDALWMAHVAQRVLLLGAAALRVCRYSFIQPLVFKRPVERRQDQYWLRYAVTIASRGEVAEVFKGKSLIGPASEALRERPEFFRLFDENMDVVVNSMCQFDYLACILTILRTGDPSRCYPNFGGYYSPRTLPMVHAIASGEFPRSELEGASDRQLAEVMNELGLLADHAFFMIAGWEGYDTVAKDFIAQHLEDG